MSLSASDMTPPEAWPISVDRWVRLPRLLTMAPLTEGFHHPHRLIFAAHQLPSLESGPSPQRRELRYE
jgi:hypothetical protein